MQRAMDQVSQSCDNYDLTISTKRQRLYQPAHGNPYNEPNITVNGQKLKLLINSPTYTWETFVPEQCTLMMWSLPELQKQERYSEDFVGAE